MSGEMTNIAAGDSPTVLSVRETVVTSTSIRSWRLSFRSFATFSSGSGCAAAVLAGADCVVEAEFAVGASARSAGGKPSPHAHTATDSPYALFFIFDRPEDKCPVASGEVQ